MPRVSVKSLSECTNALLQHWDVPLSQAVIITDTILYAHQHEKHTHGITRLPIYKQKLDEGLMTADTHFDEVLNYGAIKVLDCNHGFGQVVSLKAMETAVEKAAEYGIGVVFVRNSNNFGVAGYFGEIAANMGMYGTVITASAPAIAPEGGLKPIFGTNPVCCAFPFSEGNVVLDMAVSAAARGKIRLAEKNGEKIPLGWAVDVNGQPTDDPTAALKGNMLAIGGVKGFGLSLVFDYLAGLLSGSSFGGNIKPLASKDAPSCHGHLFAAIDIRKLMKKEEYDSKVTELVANIRSCGPKGKVFLPGERSRQKAERNKISVDLKQKQIDDFNQLLLDNGLNLQLSIVDQ